MDVIVLVFAHMCNKGPSLLRSWYAAKCSCPDFAAMSHPKISLLRGISFNVLARVVGLSPSFLYICVAPERLIVCHSNCHALSFDLLSLLFALLGVCVWLARGVGGSFEYSFASPSAISFPSIPVDTCPPRKPLKGLIQLSLSRELSPVFSLHQ